MRLSIPVNAVSEAGAVAAGSPARRAARPVLRAARESRGAMPVVRWLFYGFVFSLPFETVNFGPVEPPMIFGGLLLASALLQPELFLRWPPRRVMHARRTSGAPRPTSSAASRIARSASR